MIKHSLENTIRESIDLHKKIFHISSDINKVIKKIYKIIKNSAAKCCASAADPPFPQI